MKSKKIILTVLSIILIFILTTVSFAAKTGMTFEEAVEASKKREETSNTVTSEETTEKVEEEVKDETKEEPVEEPAEEKVDGETETVEPEEELVEEDTDKEIEEEGVVTFLETISEDIVKLGEKVEYKSTYVDGNVFIVAEEVTLKDINVDGNIFVSAATITLDNVLINGSVYIVGETIKVDGQMDSAYLCGNNVKITAFANIEKELRVAADTLDCEGIVGRTLNVYVEKFVLSDRAEIHGDCIVEAGSVDVSEDAKINGEKKITIVENTNNFSINKQNIYNTIITNCIIVFIVAIFVLYSSPKFVAVNGKLRLRDFVKAFFTGILELALAIAIFIGLAYLGYGIGFGLALLLLALIFIYFGKIIFIISAGIRLAGKSENVSRVKAFFVILVVLVIVEAVNLLQLLGVNGLIASMIINFILGIVGFGSFVRVILAPTKRVKTPAPAPANNIREAKPEDFVVSGAPIKEEKVRDKKEEEKLVQEIVEEQKEAEKEAEEMVIKANEKVKEEIKEEVKEEVVEELKEEKQEEPKEVKEKKETKKTTKKEEKEDK